MANERPVYGLTVLRYEDGRAEVIQAIDQHPDKYPEDWDSLPMPTDWQLRHAMLIDALAEVKREAGVVHTGPDPDEDATTDYDLPDLAEFIRSERRARHLRAEGLIDEASFLKLCPWLATEEREAGE